MEPSTRCALSNRGDGWQAVAPTTQSVCGASVVQERKRAHNPYPSFCCATRGAGYRPEGASVAQEYLAAPMLWDGCKWDLRLYVLVTGVLPAARAAILPTCLARLCTVPYQVPHFRAPLV